jgi:CRP/FNR family transcriptional regulator
MNNFLLPASFEQLGEHHQFKAGTELLHEGQYIKVLPLVQKGSLQVSTRFDDRELLLYYIEPGESCVMSFAAVLQQQPSRVYAVCETDCDILLLPAALVVEHIKQDQKLNDYFFQLYNQRYTALLDTIHQLIFNKLDQRLLEQLRAKQKRTGLNPALITHRQLAQELGTAREVVTRLIKKLEAEGVLAQTENGITLLK